MSWLLLVFVRLSSQVHDVLVQGDYSSIMPLLHPQHGMVLAEHVPEVRYVHAQALFTSLPFVAATITRHYSRSTSPHNRACFSPTTKLLPSGIPSTYFLPLGRDKRNSTGDISLQSWPYPTRRVCEDRGKCDRGSNFRHAGVTR